MQRKLPDTEYQTTVIPSCKIDKLLKYMDIGIYAGEFDFIHRAYEKYQSMKRGDQVITSDERVFSRLEGYKNRLLHYAPYDIEFSSTHNAYFFNG